MLKPGTRIRVAVKLHGISYLYNQTTVNLLAEVPEGVQPKTSWSGKTRIQHKIVGILIQP